MTPRLLTAAAISSTDATGTASANSAPKKSGTSTGAIAARPRQSGTINIAISAVIVRYRRCIWSCAPRPYCSLKRGSRADSRSGGSCTAISATVTAAANRPTALMPV